MDSTIARTPGPRPPSQTATGTAITKRKPSRSNDRSASVAASATTTTRTAYPYRAIAGTPGRTGRPDLSSRVSGVTTATLACSSVVVDGFAERRQKGATEATVGAPPRARCGHGDGHMDAAVAQRPCVRRAVLRDAP